MPPPQRVPRFDNGVVLGVDYRITLGSYRCAYRNA